MQNRLKFRRKASDTVGDQRVWLAHVTFRNSVTELMMLMAAADEVTGLKFEISQTSPVQVDMHNQEIMPGSCVWHRKKVQTNHIVPARRHPSRKREKKSSGALLTCGQMGKVLPADEDLDVRSERLTAT